MSVSVLRADLDPIVNMIRMKCPDLKFDKDKPNDLKRLFRKLIRDRDPILRSFSIMFDMDLPIYLILDLMQYHRFAQPIITFKTEKLIFDTSLNLTTTEENQLSCLFKKVAAIFKENNMTNTWLKVRHFLPLSTIVCTTFILNPFQIYELIEWFAWRELSSKDLRKELMEGLSKDFSVIFNEQSLEVFAGNEEKQ